MSLFEIYRGIPLPKTHRLTGGVKKYPYADLEIGDMFFVPNKAKNTLSNHASTVGKSLSRKFVTRLTWMTQTIEGWLPAEKGAEGAIQGIGVWRVEPEINLATDTDLVVTETCDLETAVAAKRSRKKAA